MNLHSKKARVPIAALGVAALCTAGLGAMSDSANAAGVTLAFGPTDTSATIVNTAPSTNAALTYGAKVTGSSGTDPFYITAITTPATAAALYAERIATNGAPAANSTFTGAVTSAPVAVTATTTAGSTAVTLSGIATASLNGALVQIGSGTSAEYAIVASGSGSTSLVLTQKAQTSQAAVAFATAGAASSANVYEPILATGTAFLSSYVAGDNVYLGATVPGAYTFRIFQDHNANGLYEAAQDDATPTFTLNVKDVTANTVTASDDLDLGLSVPASGAVGQTVPATATLGGLSAVDTRGGTVLADAIATATTFTFAASGGAAFSGGAANTGSPSYSSTTAKFSRPSGTVSAAGTITTTATLGSAGSAAATTAFTSNGVTSVTPVAATAVTGSVAYSTPNVTVKAGTAAVTYTAQVVNSVTATDIADKVVYFTLTPGTNTPVLTADGTLISNTSGTKVYTANTNSSGIATLVVTSGTTTAGTTYTVVPRSNNQPGTTQTATYATPAPSTITTSNVSAVVGGTATLSGKIVDQFGAAISTAGVPAVLAHVSGSPYFTGAGSYTVGSDGTFSATVSDVASNSTARADTFTWAVGGVTSATKTLSWRTSVTPGAIAVNTITTNGGGSDVSLPFAATTTRVDLASSAAFSGDVETLKGTLKDTASTPQILPFTNVTYSGSDGVLFYDVDGKLVKTLTARTNSSGLLSYDESTDGVRVLFTKSGTATITTLAGTATKAITVPVEDATDSYKVIAQDTKSKPGQTVTLLGKVSDAFDNPVVGRQVTVALSAASAGTLSGTDANGTLVGFQVATDTTGVWSTPFTSTANQNGNVTLTATLVDNSGPPPTANLTVNPTANAAYTTAGITIPHGEYQDTAAIQVVDPTVGIAVTGTLVGGGKAQLSGTAEAGASVDLYARASGETGFALVKSLNADPTGMWGVGSTIVKTTAYFARSGGKTSDTVTATVISTQTVTAKALGKGKVRFTVLGTPNVAGVVNIYYGSKRLAHAGTDSHGDATVDVQAKAGRRTFTIYFVAPGTSTRGTSLTGTVK